jgi:DNA-binding MarR family transcriptional regulator
MYFLENRTIYDLYDMFKRTIVKSLIDMVHYKIKHNKLIINKIWKMNIIQQLRLPKNMV